MRFARAAIPCALIVAVGVVLVSGGSDSDPRTPAALPGLPPPFLGTAVSGDGGLTAAIDAYGDVVDLRPDPAGAPLIDNPSDRQAAGTVPADTGIVPRVRIGDGDALPMWQAESVTQHYLPGTNVVRTVARFDAARVTVTTAAEATSLAVVVRARATGGEDGASKSPSASPSLPVNVESGIRCAREGQAGQLDLICKAGRAVLTVPGAAANDAVTRECARLIKSAARDTRRWLDRSRRLGGGAPTGVPGSRSPAAAASGAAGPQGHPAPAWARSMYERSLLTIHALTSRKTGAVAAGARDGWAYVWPRDAATAALALESSGHGAEARQAARFLTGLNLPAAARFTETGAPVPGRAAQGDAAGWVTAAANATGIPAPHKPFAWRARADYQESTPGTYLANALANSDVDGPKTRHIGKFSAHQHEGAEARIAGEFGTPRGLVRIAGDPGSGLDSAAGWAVRPFGLRPLYPAAEETLLHLVEGATLYGITPGEGWTGGEDPWSAPTAWSAWSLAALAREPHRHPPRPRLRRSALNLLADVRRAATPAGDLPERVDAHTGIPTSTTPLLWSSAFTVLALRELWP